MQPRGTPARRRAGAKSAVNASPCSLENPEHYKRSGFFLCDPDFSTPGVRFAQKPGPAARGLGAKLGTRARAQPFAPAFFPPLPCPLRWILPLADRCPPPHGPRRPRCRRVLPGLPSLSLPTLLPAAPAGAAVRLVPGRALAAA